MRRASRRVCVAAVGAALLWGAQPAAAEPIWRLEQPPPPAGSPFTVPLGAPGDLEFYGPNRGLLAVEGNATVPPGLVTWDGENWHQLSTVCGGPARNVRIALAGPREFWTVTVPSRPRDGAGASLCHFKDGQVVASYSTPLESPDPYREMDAAACNGPSDCWFGGFGATDATGERRGAFHLHWDGTSLQTVYAPQGRGVTDIAYREGTFFETTAAGRAPGDATSPVDLAQPETEPHLIHRITDGAFANDPFLPASSYLAPNPIPFLPPISVPIPPSGSELLALGGNGQTLWAGGGGATSGPAAANGVVARPPLAARLDGDTWTEVPLTAAKFGPRDRLVDIAAVPGADSAWAALEPFGDRGQPGKNAIVAQIGADGATSLTTLPASGAGRGSAAKIAFTSPTDGWMVTSLGWVFHYTDGSVFPRDSDPAFAGTITFRPNEAAEQFVPDAPPVDDSELFKPPPVEVQPDVPPAAVKRIPALLRKVKTKLVGRTLVVSFTLTRKARVGIVARRKGRVVAHTRPRMMDPGRHALRLKLDRRRWPQRLSFSAREPGVGGGGGSSPGGDNGDTVTTGNGDTVATSRPR